jgi:diguanylate cyclase (GGDEF)-like protein
VLKAQPGRYLPVLMVSSRNTVQDRVSGLRSGADDFIGKPYDPEELRARVEVLLRTQAAFAGQRASAAGGASERSVDEQELDRRALPQEFLNIGERAHAPMSEDAFRQRMESVFEAAERNSDPLACVLVELDNPPWGTDPVDIALRTEVIHGAIAGSLRKVDLINPRGDMGFTLLLPNTHFPGALTVAERIAREVKRRSRARGRGFTVSIGISFYPNRDTRALKDMLDLVAAALARAREEGGGKICLFQHQGYLYAPED